MKLRTRTPLIVATLTLAPLALAGCGSDSGTGGDGDGLSVVASMYPLEFLVERIGGDDVDLTTLANPGQEPHDLELTVSQTAALADADLVVYVSDLQPAVDESVDTNAGGEVVEALDVLESRQPAIGGARPVTVLDAGDDEHADEDHADDDEHADEDGHDHGAHDPHFWLDPRALATVGAEVADQLSALDPDNATAYEERYAELMGDLVGLDGRASVALETCARRTVVVSHDAFGYLGYRYDLDFEPIAGLSPDAEPSPARMAELADLIEDTGITTVFTETLASPALADTLASELGLVTDVLDPLEGLTEDAGDADYLSVMDANIEALRKAGDCT